MLRLHHFSIFCNGKPLVLVCTRFGLSMEVSTLTRDGTAEFVSLDQNLRRERGQENFHFLCSDEHERDWQPYLTSSYSACSCDNHTYMHTIVLLRSTTYKRFWFTACLYYYITKCDVHTSVSSLQLVSLYHFYNYVHINVYGLQLV